LISTRTAHCRHGVFTYHSQDRFLGTSLRIYGEWSEDEVLMYDVFLKPTDIAIEVGANIGALTVPLARRCNKVIAFEPQPENYALLCSNLSCNNISNVDHLPFAVGAKNGTVKIQSLNEIDEVHGVIGDYGGFVVGSSGSHSVEQHTLDSMKFDKIDFIKMDCEGSELDVLRGGEKLIKRDWPLLYIENDKVGKSAALVEWLIDHGYYCYWHRPPLYREDNYRKYIDNIFGNCKSANMICCRDRNRNHDWLTEKVLL
jgi:FkbM family methyltransferase